MPKDSVSDADIAEYREIFSLVDLDHGGTIDCEELGELPVKNSQSTFTHWGSEWGTDPHRPSAPQIRSQRLCI